MKLDKLIFYAVAPATLLALVVFTAFDSLLALLNEVDEIGIGSYDFLRVVEYIALTVPRRAYQYFSTATVVGVTLGLGLLAARSELIALQAAGASRLRIGASVMLALLPLLVLALFLGEWLGPRGDRMANDLAAQSKSQGIAFSGSGLWLRDGLAVWNARRALTPAEGPLELWELWRYQFDIDARLVEVIRAEHARFEPGRWTLHKLSRDHLTPEAVRSETLDELVVESLLDPALVASHTLRPRQQGTADLAETIRYAKVNRLDSLSFESAYWYRLCYPLLVLALAFAATPFAFGSLRSGGTGKRLMLGMSLGVGFFFLHRTLINLAETERSGLLLVNLGPILLLFLWGVWRLRRVE